MWGYKYRIISESGLDIIYLDAPGVEYIRALYELTLSRITLNNTTNLAIL